MRGDVVFLAVLFPNWVPRHFYRAFRIEWLAAHVLRHVLTDGVRYVEEPG